METWDAERLFMEATGYPIDSVEIADFRKMLDDEIGASKFPKRTRYTDKVEISCARIIDWYKQGRANISFRLNEKNLDDIIKFVADYRRAAVWAILLGRRDRK